MQKQKIKTRIDRALEIEARKASNEFEYELIRLESLIPIYADEAKRIWVSLTTQETPTYEVIPELSLDASNHLEAYLEVSREWVTMIRRYHQLCRFLNRKPKKLTKEG